MWPFLRAWGNPSKLGISAQSKEDGPWFSRGEMMRCGRIWKIFVREEFIEFDDKDFIHGERGRKVLRTISDFWFIQLNKLIQFSGIGTAIRHDKWTGAFPPFWMIRKYCRGFTFSFRFIESLN